MPFEIKILGKNDSKLIFEELKDSVVFKIVDNFNNEIKIEFDKYNGMNIISISLLKRFLNTILNKL